MKLGVLAAIGMLFVMSNANAQNMVARDAIGNSATLMSAPCLAAPWLKTWKQASILWESRVYAACWKEQGGMIVILDSAGDMTPIPVDAFARETGV